MSSIGYHYVVAWVHRYQSVEGARSELDFRRDEESTWALILTENVGDEAFATGYGTHCSIHFRKGNFYVELATDDSLAVAREYAKIIESRIEIPINIRDYLIPLLIIAVVALSLIVVVTEVRRRRRKPEISEVTQPTAGS